MKIINLLLIVLMVFCGIYSHAQQSDWRNVNSVPAVIPHEHYICQEYVVVADNGDWVAVVTTGPGGESHAGQHMISTTSSDQGKTWTEPVDIEPGGADLPAASWGVPYITTFGRIYVFYNYNGDNINVFGGDTITHNSELGWYCYKFSDDHGKSWSERYRLPLKKTPVDFINRSNGEVQLFWGVCKPITVENSMLFSFTKLAQHPQDMGEGWLFKSNNINTEKDPGKLNWEKYPDSDETLKTWYKVAMKADWRNSIDVKTLYRNASVVGDSRIVLL